MPTLNGPTVAEQVAALPPVSQLLGIDQPKSPRAQVKRKGKTRAGLTSPPRGAEGGVKAASSPSQSPGTHRQPSPRSPNATVRALTKLMSVANSTLPACPLVNESEGNQSPKLSPPSSTGSGVGFRQWRHVARSLELPIEYRSEEDIQFTLRLLRSLPFFARLLESELLTLVETIELVEVADAGQVLLRKAPLDDSTDWSTTAGIGAATGSVSYIDKQSLPSLPFALPGLDDSGKQEPLSRVLGMPAEQLFRCFKEQIGRGERPFLPPGCMEKGPGADGDGELYSGMVDKPNPNDEQSPLASVIAIRSTVGVSTTPLFSSSEDPGEKDDIKPFALILLSGGCRLEWPRQRGLMEDFSETPLWHAYGLQSGDAMGYDLIWAALPPGAQYVTSQKSMILVVRGGGRPVNTKTRLQRLFTRVNETVFLAQKHFLESQLRFALFDCDGYSSGKTTSSPSNVDATASNDVERTHASTLTPGPVVGVDPADPTVESLLEHAARNVIPIRIATGKTLLREGLSPVEECAIYFVVEGGLVVSRRIWSQDQQRLLAEREQLVRVLTPVSGSAPSVDSLPRTDEMEVAQLRTGDCCGELAYLDEDPDDVDSFDEKWTSAYLQNTLAEPITNTSHVSTSGTLIQPARHHPTDPAASRGGKKSLFRRHRATVVAQQASLLYVMLPRAADKALSGSVLRRLRNHIHCDYSGYRRVFNEYEKYFKWALYKERVLCDVSRKVPVNFR